MEQVKRNDPIIDPALHLAMCEDCGTQYDTRVGHSCEVSHLSMLDVLSKMQDRLAALEAENAELRGQVKELEAERDSLTELAARNGADAILLTEKLRANQQEEHRESNR